MSQENITLILLAVIGLVFLIDFIKNNSKNSIEKSVEGFVEKEKEEDHNDPLDWILNRKKNISLSIILIPLFKVLTHFFLFPNLHEVVVDNIPLESSFEGKPWSYVKEIKEKQPMNLGHHFEIMFIDRLELFIPVTIVFLIVIWFFNDKIKAQ